MGPRLPGFPPPTTTPYPQCPCRIPLPISPQQRKAAAALLREEGRAGRRAGQDLARQGHDLALVGGPVRDVFLGRAHSDLDLATDATPAQVLSIARESADRVWETGIEFGTVGLLKDGTGVRDHHLPQRDIRT